MNDIEQLKRYVISSKDLSEAFHYFFDLVDNDTFFKIKSHHLIQDIHQYPELLTVMQLVKHETNERLGKSIKHLTPVFHGIPEYYFFHGPCLSDDFIIPLTVIYFSDIKTGLFAITDAKTDMMRFSLMKVSDMMNKQ
jgi:hypothetical protein